MKCYGVCDQCGKRHAINFDPRTNDPQISDWYTKHMGHDGVRIVYPARPSKTPGWIERLQRAWRFVLRKMRWGATAFVILPTSINSQVYESEGFAPTIASQLAALLHNADTKVAYGSSAAYTCSLASLATSSTLLAGREGTAVNNTTNLYLDYLAGGIVTVGTTPTANNFIEWWMYGSVNDTPTYPDVFDGTDSDETVTNAGVKQSALANFGTALCSAATSNVGYWFSPRSVAMAFGGLMPKHHGPFITHSTAVNLNSTAGNHVLSYTGCFLTTS